MEFGVGRFGSGELVVGLVKRMGIHGGEGNGAMEEGRCNISTRVCGGDQ